MEGTRPLLVEIQALVAPTSLGTPRRAVVGWDPSRLSMVLAVLEAHGGLRLGMHDVYLNVAGGLRISEPAADLAAAAALVSSLSGAPLPADTVYFGEIGLSGAIRPVAQTPARLKEAAKLGFAQRRRAERPRRQGRAPASGRGLDRAHRRSRRRRSPPPPVHGRCRCSGAGKGDAASFAVYTRGQPARPGHARFRQALRPLTTMPVSVLDLVVLGVVLISALLAAVRGFTREVLAIVAWVTAAAAAWFLHKAALPYAEQYIDNKTIALVAAIGGIFILTLIVVSVITVKISDLILDSRIGALDRTLGFVFGAGARPPALRDRLGLPVLARAREDARMGREREDPADARKHRQLAHHHAARQPGGPAQAASQAEARGRGARSGRCRSAARRRAADSAPTKLKNAGITRTPRLAPDGPDPT